MNNKIGKIGEGTYGAVYHIKTPNGTRDYALKRNYSVIADFIGSVRELDMLHSLRKHPFITTLLQIYNSNDPTDMNGTEMFSPLKHDNPLAHQGQVKNDNIHFVLEKATYCFASHMAQEAPTNISVILKYMVQVLLALEYIHVRGIVHRDIKPNNILYKKDFHDIDDNYGCIQICDFGFSKILSAQEKNTPHVVSYWYRAPELALGSPDYDYSIDIWSAGCVFFEMFSRKILFMGSSDDDAKVFNVLLQNYPYPINTEILKLYNKNRFHIPRMSKKSSSFISKMNINPNMFGQINNHIGMERLEDLFLKMINFDPRKRYTATQLLDSEIFAGLRNYIHKYRKLAVPVPYPPVTMFINSCVERTYGLNMAMNIYNKFRNANWYTHRVLFHSIDYYDFFISQIFPSLIDDPINPVVYSTYDCELRYMVCLYLAIKMYSPAVPIPYRTIAPKKYQTQSAYLVAESFEKELIIKYLRFNIHRETVYEAADKLNYALKPDDIVNLLLIIYKNPNISNLPVKDIVHNYIRGNYGNFLREERKS